MMRSRLLLACSLLTLGLTGAARAGANLVVNGDFHDGNTGFGTDYALTTMTPFLFQNGVHGIYAIEPAADIAGSAQYGDWTNISTDPSGGDGNVYVADAATTSDAVVWSETLTVTPNTKYTFSYDGAEVSNACCSNASFASTVNGAPGPILNATAAWQSSAVSFNSGVSTVATLSVTDTNTSGPYNDFALDDFSLTSSVPEPRAWALLLVGFGGLGAGARLMRKRGFVAA